MVGSGVDAVARLHLRLCRLRPLRTDALRRGRELEFEAAEEFAWRSPIRRRRSNWIELAGILAFLLQRSRGWFAAAVATLLGVCMICGDREDVIHSGRSFCGVLRVEVGIHTAMDKIAYHTLMHGSTMHGKQSRDPGEALDPWTYYYRSGPVAKCSTPWNSAKHFLGRATSASWAWGPAPSPPTPSRSIAHLFRDRRCGEEDLAESRVLHLSHRLQSRGAARSPWAMPG